MESKTTIKLRVKTNKFINMIIAIEPEKTMRELAHRVLNCYHQLANEHTNPTLKRRDLTVSAIKIENFYIAKSQVISNLLKDNDQIQCILAKAKPKYPNQPKAYNNTMKLINQSNAKQLQRPNSLDSEKNFDVMSKKQQSFNNKRQNIKSKKQRKKEKKMLKLKEQEIMKKQIQQKKLSNKIENQSNAKVNQFDLKQERNYNIRQFTFSINKRFPIFGKKENQELVQKENHRGESNQKNSNILVNSSFASTISNHFNGQNQQFQGKDIQVQKRQKSPSIDKKEINLMSLNRQKETNKKKNKINSILQMLSKATQEKQKKNKKKQKKLEKNQESLAQLNNKIFDKNINAQVINSLKPLKNQKDATPTSKIASPKVTFHTSPINSPQLYSLSSPKRKTSNPSIEKLQKMELEGNLQSKFLKKDIQKQKKPMTTTSKPLEIGSQVKKQNPPNSAPKIIVEQSEAESGEVQQKVKEETMPSRQIQQAKNSKLAALDAKLSKYKLQFFNDSDNEEE